MKKKNPDIKLKWYDYFGLFYQTIWNIVLFAILTFILMGCLAVGIGAGYVAALVKDTPVMTYDEMKTELGTMTETTDVYFAGGEKLGSLRADTLRTVIPYDKVSPYIINGLISTEDPTFFSNDGVVPKSTLRAMIQEIVGSNSSSGGSTLTQQLIKNQILTRETSYARKAKEILLALRANRMFDKKDILYYYLNVVDLGRNTNGQNVSGIEATARGLFGISAQEVNLAQAAYIAGLPQAPFLYTPFTNTGELKNDEQLAYGFERQKYVLKQMLKYKYITQQQYDEAVAFDLKSTFIDNIPNLSIDYPYVITEAKQRIVETLLYILAEQDGYNREDVNNSITLKDKYFAKAENAAKKNGYRVTLTIDKNVHDALNNAAKYFDGYGGEYIASDGKAYPVQIGAMAIDNTTGKILGFVGGRDFEEEQTNHATQTLRSTGSSIKPLVVYAPALEMGYISPNTLLLDRSFNYEGWTPQNYAGIDYGWVTAREALYNSYNLSAIRLYSGMLDKRPAEYLKKMGYTSLTEQDYTNLATAIGGLSQGVSVEENTNAFTTFANDGVFKDAYMVAKITDSNGKVIYEKDSEAGEQVYSPETAYMIVDMLKGVLTTGSANQVPSLLNFGSGNVYAKTGTSDGVYDSWMVGGTKRVTLGAWLGYDQPATLPSDATIKYVWATLLNSLYGVDSSIVSPEEGYTLPDNLDTRTMCQLTNGAPVSACPTSTDLFNTTLPFNTVTQPAEDQLTLLRNGINIDASVPGAVQGAQVTRPATPQRSQTTHTNNTNNTNNNNDND